MLFQMVYIDNKGIANMLLFVVYTKSFASNHTQSTL